MSSIVGVGYAVSPGNSSLLYLKNEVANFVKMPLSSRGMIAAGNAIKSGVKKLNTRGWRWSAAYQDIYLQESVADYPLDPEFRSPIHCHALDTDFNPRYILGFVPFKTLEQNFPCSTGDNSPSQYTVYPGVTNRSLTLDAPVSSGYAGLYPWLRLRFLSRIAYPSSDSAPILVPNEVELFIKWWAYFEMAAIYRPDKVKMAREEAERLWVQLVVDEDEADETDWSQDEWD